MITTRQDTGNSVIALCLMYDVLKILYPGEKPTTEICTNNSRPFSQPWNGDLLKFNTRKCASKGECLLITQFLCSVVSPYLEPRLQSLATTSCSCRPLLAFPKASCCEALILQSLGALQDCKQTSRDQREENQEFSVNWSWIIQIGLHLNAGTAEGLCFCLECFEFACTWASSLPPPAENPAAWWKNSHTGLSDCSLLIYCQAINDFSLATALLASLPLFYRGKAKA